MSGLTQGFFSRQAVHFSEGRIASMARCYVTPLPVEIEDHYFLLRRQKDVAAAFAAKRAGMSAAGIRRLRVGVRDERTTRRGKLSATVEWFCLGDAGSRQARTMGRYFLCRHNGGLAVEMIALWELSTPEIRDWFVAHADPPARQAAGGPP